MFENWYKAKQYAKQYNEYNEKLFNSIEKMAIYESQIFVKEELKIDLGNEIYDDMIKSNEISDNMKKLIEKIGEKYLYYIDINKDINSYNNSIPITAKIRNTDQFLGIAIIHLVSLVEELNFGICIDFEIIFDTDRDKENMGNIILDMLEYCIAKQRIKLTFSTESEMNTNLENNKLIIGKINNDDITIGKSNREQNIALIGSVASGKLSTTFIPMMKQDLKDKNNSLLLISDNDEILNIMKSFGIEYGNKISIIDISQTIRCNDLKIKKESLYFKLKDNDKSNVEEDFNDNLVTDDNEVYFELERAIKNNEFIIIKLSKNHDYNEMSLRIILDNINSILSKDSTKYLNIYFDNFVSIIKKDSFKKLNILQKENYNNLTLTITMTDENLIEIMNIYNNETNDNIKSFLYESIGNYFIYCVFSMKYRESLEKLFLGKFKYLKQKSLENNNLIELDNIKNKSEIIDYIYNKMSEVTVWEYHAYIYDLELKKYKIYKLKPNFID